MVLSETKLYGIPNLLLGLDYVAISNKGTKIVYDDTPESLAKCVIRILKNSIYRRILGKEAKKSMLNFNNNLLLEKWTLLIMGIYNGNEYYKKFREKNKKIDFRDYMNILKNQIDLMNMRKKFVEIININNFENFTFMSNLTEIK